MRFQSGKSDVTIQDSAKELLEKAMLCLQGGDMGAVVDCIVLALSIIEEGSFPEVN